MKRGRRTAVGKAKASAATAVAPEEPQEPKIPTTIRITGLARPWSDEELKEKVTSIANVEIVEFHVQDNRSSANITLPDADSAATVITELNGKTINDKAGAKPITVELYVEEASPVKMDVSEPEPANTSGPSSSAIPTNRAEAIEQFQQEQLKHYTQDKGFLVTKTQPPLLFRPKPEEQVKSMRKRRNYDLDSTVLSGRFYATREKRRHKPGKVYDDAPASSSALTASKSTNTDERDVRDTNNGSHKD